MSTTEPVTYVRSEDLLAEPPRPKRVSLVGVGGRRQLAGVSVAALGLSLLTLLLDNAGSSLSLESDVLLYLLVVVSVAVVGGVAVGLGSAIAAAFLINYFFVKPVHTFEVDQNEQVLMLVVFLVVAAVVSGSVEFALRRAKKAEQAVRESQTLSALAGGDLRGTESLKDVLTQARATFRMESVTLSARDGPSGEWREVEQVGWAPAGEEAPLQFDVPAGDELRLIGRGPALFAEDQRVLQAFAAAAQTAFEGRRLGQKADEARELAAADRQRTSLLAGVGHDLRTPLAGIKASVSTLRQTDVDWSDQEREELLATIEESTDRLDSIVGNLLDASRLQAGVLSVQLEPIALDEIIGAAILAVPGASTCATVDVPEDLPLVQADPGLLERVLANLLENAMDHGSDDSPVEVSALATAESAKLTIIDHGPGIPEGDRERLFQPFQRLDGEPGKSGVGLGLTVARGFVEAMDGSLIADGSSNTGLIMRLRLPLAR